MNKYEKSYQEVLDEIRGYLWCDMCKFKDEECERCERIKNAKILQELVDKATPKKPTGKKPFIAGMYAFCPSCHSMVSEVGTVCYCDHCGQKLDWSNDD